MDPTAQRAKEIFLGLAGNVPAQEWENRLDDICAGNSELRQRVQALLRAHADPRSYLDPPAIDPTSDAEKSQEISERSGTMIGPYKLLEQIGEGGFGVVFMAEQTEPVRRKVALKVLKPGMDTRHVVARFEAERQALAIMDHPNIARVFDGGAAASGRPFFVMELVKGAPITDYCDQNHLTPRERLELFGSLCHAVQHAHQKGIIHRDLKPSNVLVTLHDTTPVVKVIDFGVAKALGQELTERTLFTGFAQMIGTPLYMSPEQAGQSNLDIDTRSDIYSLGVLLYELLSGTTPFDKERFKQTAYDEIRRIIREEEPPKPSTRLSTTDALPSIAANRKTEPRKLSGVVRGELDWIVMKALEKDRNRRYETANGFAADVERYLSDEPVQACPPSAGYRLRKFARRNKAAIAVTVVIAALLVIGTVVSSGLALWATRAEGLAQERLESEKSERQKAIEAERERKRQLVGAKLAQARAGRWSRQVGQRFDGLRALTEAAALARELEMDAPLFQQLRDEMVACLALADIRPLKDSWEGFPAGSSAGLGFDADLERYARSDTKGNIEVRQVDGDRLLARLPGHGPGGGASGAADIRFSPDGGLLAVTYWHQIPDQRTNFQVWDWRRQQVVFQPPANVPAVDFRPDGRRLALGQGDGTVTVYEVDGWKEANRLKVESTPTYLAFHPDGTRLAVAGQGGTVQVWQMATGKLLFKVSAPNSSFVAWHPDGDLLAANYGDRNVHLWDGVTGQTHAVLSGHQSEGIALAFAAGGDLVVSSAWDGSSRLWDPWTGRELLRFTGDAQHVSRDGRRLASRAGHSLTLWEVNPGREYLPLPYRPGTRMIACDISPDGRWLAAGGERCRLWDLDLRKEVAALPVTNVADTKFHPTGGELFTSGLDGLYRWSFEVAGELLRVKQQARLLPPGRLERLGLDRDGRLLVVGCIGRGGTILDLMNPPGRVPPLQHNDAIYAALSPDAQWAATGTHNGFGVRVWYARTGKLVKELIQDDRNSRPIFSPDGRWLLTATGTEFEIWEPGTWRWVRRLPREQTGDGAAAAAFAPDGKVLAVAVSLTTVRLFDTATWRPLARLQGSDADLISAVGFTPDGTRLLISGAGGVIRVWDLRRIREQLALAGLDWDQPAYPPARPTGDVKRVRVEVDTAAYERLKNPSAYFMKEAGTHAQAFRWADAADACSRAIKLDPNDALAHYNLGRALLNLGEFAEALQAFKRGHELGSTSAQWVKYCERLLTLDQKLSAILQGEAQPQNAAEQLELANCLRFKKHNDAAARFYAAAFAAEPKEAGNQVSAVTPNSHRYDAACAAALASAGQGTDAGTLTEQQRADWRKQALAWLGADLEELKQRLQKGTSEEAQFALYLLRHWQKDPDLSRVREAGAQQKLPEAERKEWEKLWSDVHGLIQTASRNQ